ncbi:MAG: patatin-like phospholipase family protein, partial [Pseudomonadota bacterium]
AAIAGASAGAVIGAAYASGMAARDIRAHALDLASNPIAALRTRLSEGAVSLSGWRSVTSAETALSFILPDAVPDDFAALRIPLTVVATDFYARRACYFRDGALMPVLAATIAIPGILSAVLHEGRVYVDGGVTDNLPLSALPKTDVTLAVDVASEPAAESAEVPSAAAAAAGAMRIMMHALLNERLGKHPGAILIQPASRRYGALQFDRVRAIIEEADNAREETKRAIERALT